MSLRWRVALGLGLITLLVVGFVGVAAYVATADRLEASVDDSLEQRAADVTQVALDAQRDEPRRPTTDEDRDDESPEGADSDFTRPANCPPAGLFQPAAAAQLVSADGTVTACIEGGIDIPVVGDDREIAAGETEDDYLRTIEIDGKRYRVITVPLSDGTALQIARGLGEVDSVLDSMRQWLLGIGAVGVAAAFGLGWLLARRTVRPVERLRDTAEQIAATQDLAVDVPIGGPSEIASLGRSFTTMVDALGTSRAEQQRLVSDASHELRTPLTSLRTNAELLRRSDELTAQQQRSVVDGIELEVDELTHLVSELVELATDSSTDDEPIESVDLGALASEVVARARRRTGREITLEVTDPVTLDLAPQAITRAISNLVDNACKYSDGPVDVVVTGRQVEVRDRGPGIPEADRPHVFDRFYRSATARTEPGSGLGLSIVAQAVTRHGGRVWATDRTDPDATGHLGAAVGFEL
jgi:two-component system sensor histidine kinase MprB